jgi:hypothetical protein
MKIRGQERRAIGFLFFVKTISTLGIAAASGQEHEEFQEKCIFRLFPHRSLRWIASAYDLRAG